MFAYTPSCEIRVHKVLKSIWDFLPILAAAQRIDQSSEKWEMQQKVCEKLFQQTNNCEQIERHIESKAHIFARFGSITRNFK